MTRNMGDIPRTGEKERQDDRQEHGWADVVVVA